MKAPKKSTKAAMFYGLPSHGRMIVRCASCGDVVMVEASYKKGARPARVVLFDVDVNGNKQIHTLSHQPTPEWVDAWDTEVRGFMGTERVHIKRRRQLGHSYFLRNANGDVMPPLVRPVGGMLL